MFHWAELLADRVTALLPVAAGSPFAMAANFFVFEFFKVLALILAISWVAALIRGAMPMQRIRTWLAGGRFRFLGYPAAALFGAVTPFCSCSSVPLTIGFLEAGIPLGVTMAFLITSPLVNEVVVAMFIASFGWKTAALYAGAGIALGIAGGLVVNALRVEAWLAGGLGGDRPDGAGSDTAGGCCGGGSCGAAKPPPTLSDRAFAAVRESLQITWKILPYLAVALLLGAGMHGWLPENFFARFFRDGEWWSVPAATLVGFPLYASANATVPVLQTLVAKGVPLGTAMAFVMSAVGVSLPELILLKRVMTVRLLALFSAIVLIGTALVGYGFNFVGVLR